MAENKLFTIINEGDSGMVSKVRTNREYLLNKSVAAEFNTYLSFNPFRTFNDMYDPEYDKDNDYKEILDKKNGPGTPGVRSLFNKAGAVVIGSTDGNLDTAKNSITGRASEWRLSQNVPLMDTPENRKVIRENSKCTVKDLVEYSQKGLLGKETYDYSDFMYCKYLGKVPNNYLITLRRFPYPVDDYISSEGLGATRKLKEIASQNAQSIGCMVTWLGTPGNEMSNILKYNFSMPFKTQEAQWEETRDNGDQGTGPLNSIAAIFDTKYREQYMAGRGGAAANSLMNTFFKPLTGGKLELANGPYDVKELDDFRDRNKIYGPVDAIKSTYMRGDGGLEFQQDISLTFDYELRYYNGINARQAMLDLLSNILNVTYTTGTFWGGGYRSAGQHQNNVFANLNIFKAKGGATEFYDAFQKDCSNVLGGVADKLSNMSLDGFKTILSKIANIAGGMILGGLLNKAGRPQQMMANSLLSPAPIGFWHVTVGNPHHPILSVGNMILKNTTIEHYGPLGLDDFPTGIKVTCELTRGKPRDLRDIEKMYMKGNERIYTSMGPKVFEMYKSSKNYKESSKGSADLELSPDVVKNVKIEQKDLKGMSNTIQKYFGHTDTYSIYVAACEQEYGASKPKKTGAAAGDSRQKGTGHGNK